MTLKALSAAAFAGCVILGSPALAENLPSPVAEGQDRVANNQAPVILSDSEESQNFLKQKPVDTPTLDYLHENNVKIPQKKYDEATSTWVDGGEPITAPESAYTITAGTADDYTFVYKTADENGNVTDSYYKIELKSLPLEGGDTGEGVNPSSHVTWQEVDAPAEGAGLPANTIKVELPNGVKYYQYTYHQPEDYTTATGRIDDTLVSANVNKVVFEKLTSSSGGAIYNTKDNSSVDILADFIGNSVRYSGGAIYNKGTIDNITGDFIGNSADGSGGAIYNSGTIGNITGDFIGNSADGSGGAICNVGKIGNITGDFIGNSAGYAGGAIYNNGTIGDITGNFINNSASDDYSSFGGAIANYANYFNGTSIINSITGNFINNTASYGGAISNIIRNLYGGDGYDTTLIISNIKGDFIGNSALYDGGAIYNGGDDDISTIGNITGDFIGNSARKSGGAIYNGAMNGFEGNFYCIFTISNITGNFISNSASSGGAIYNQGTIGNITGDFIGNSSLNPGGAIFNEGTIGNITGDFIGNYAQSTSKDAKGGAIYNSWATIGAKDETGNIVGGIINSSFIGNYAKTETGKAEGGAIWTNKDLNIIADNATSEISGNYTESAGVRDDNAIYVSSSSASINFKLQNGGKIAMYDNIRGASKTTTETDESGNEVTKITDSYKVNITGDSVDNTTFYMLNDMYSANLSVDNTTLNTVNNQTHTYNVNSFTLTGDTNMVADVDLANQEMDRFTATTYGEHQGNLNVVGMNLLSDAPEDRPVTEIYFAEQGLKDHVTGNVPLPQENVQNFEFYTPIYKYNAVYDNREDAGYFLFTKGDKYFRPVDPTDPEDKPIVPGGGTTVTPTGNPSDAFNPAVLSAPVSGVAASQATINETFKYVFEHADAFTQMPAPQRNALMNSNKYAISTDFNHNLGSLCPEHNNKAGWARPYVTFENMHLKNGPKVDAITYGTLVGYDTDFHEHKHGWHSVGTGYIGYNGSQLSYKGVDTTMNGGLLGYTHTMYKGNFWTALTASAGASVGQSNTMYGKEDFTSLLAGVGSKTGYNFEFKEGKYILQPIMFMSYTFVNTFDYTNAAGVKVKPSPAHSIQLSPSIRFIANTKNGWQPYASVGMVWNLLNENKVTANDVRLPEMGMKPYVEYGVGLQRNWKDKFTAFGQAMLRNGGRNGIALTAGFRWALGKDGKPIEKVQNDATTTLARRERVGVRGQQPSTSLKLNIMSQQDILARANGYTSTVGTKKIVKQMTPQQKTALGVKPQNTTRTTNIGVIK